MGENIKKSGIITSSNIAEHNMKILPDGSVWILIFWHDVSSIKEWFADKTEADYCINKLNRYSKLKDIERYKTLNGVYEYLLMYPRLSATLYNRWTQTSLPSATSVTGFNAITTAWNNYNKGIAKSADSSTIYNCNGGLSTWFGSIGQIRAWSAGSMPASNGSQQYEVSLWVRVDNTLGLNTKFFDDTIMASSFYEI